MKSVSRMQDLTIHASDGEIGRVEEFYFDDETWTIRYLIVKTGGWLFGRLVLISPIFLRSVDWEAAQLNIALTKQQIENSPEIDRHKPVSRQHEADYMDALGGSYYWGGPGIWGIGAGPATLATGGAPISARAAASTRESADSHLRSTSAVKGYRIEATDGEIGQVDDFIVDLDTWSIRYLQLSWSWLPGKEILISPEWIGQIRWAESEVFVGLTREAIKSAPEYIESRSITREYEDQLHAHYGRRPYSPSEPQAKRVLAGVASDSSAK